MFQRDWWAVAGLHSQSKQWRIEFLYRYKPAKTSRITVANIRKPYLYLFILNCMFTLGEDRQSIWEKNWCARNKVGSRLLVAVFKIQLKMTHRISFFLLGYLVNSRVQWLQNGWCGCRSSIVSFTRCRFLKIKRYGGKVRDLKSN